MKRFILFSLLITGIAIPAVLLSCKKETGKIVINGSVYDPDINIPVAGASVTVSSSSISNGFYNPNYTDIASATTDAGGKFSFTFTQQKVAGYRIYISKEKYFDNTIDIPAENLVQGTPYTPSYNLYPTAYFKLHVKNTSPIDSNDFIAYSYSSNMPACFECCNNNTMKGYGKNYDVTLKCKTFGSRNIIINGHITKFGTDQAFSDTVFCAPFDTTFYQIFY